MTSIGENSDIFQKINKSAGAEFLNRSHQRSFSLNIFRMNAIALIEAIQRVKDPDQGMTFMLEANREGRLQAHRELNRHIHNFVSSALALVEHTRVFMREHYADTKMLESYETQVVATFAQSHMTQFIQGLRNYMVHKGLPNSSMYMKFIPIPEATGGMGVLETGIQYETASLLDWDRWNPMARKYLEQAEGHLDIHDFAQEYMELVNQFHGWLDDTLEEHHRPDLQELGRLQAESDLVNSAGGPVPPTVQSESISDEPFHFTPAQEAKLNRLSVEIFDKVRELNFKKLPPCFPTERPATVITDGDVIGPIRHWGDEETGGSAYSFVDIKGTPYGLGETDYGLLDGLADLVLEAHWARGSLSRKFVETTFFDWASNRLQSREQPFSDALKEAAKRSVATIEVCAPIAHMEIENGFEFGPVRIEPVTSEYMARLESTAGQIPAEYQVQAKQLFERLRKEIQGSAAVFITIDAEAEFAVERALRIAQDAVGLLSFFAPAARRSDIFNPVGLVGASCIPSMKLITTYDGGSTLIEGILPKGFGVWRMSAPELSALQSGLLDAAASLLRAESLSEFHLAIRASILNYTKGTTLTSPLDRLRNCLSSLEGVLLKHDMEPRSHSIANRMSVLLNGDREGGPSVGKTVQQIYWLLEQPAPTEYGRRESELIATFTLFAYDVLHLALGNASRFSSKSGFLDAVDRMGQSRQ
jgi:hypothetical protein